MTDKIIAATDISYSYSGSIVLDRLSFDIYKGDFLAVIGRNGVGKSTLLKIINRVISGYKGAIDIYDRQHNSYSAKELARIIAYVPQQFNSEQPFTVKEFIEMSSYPYSSLCGGYRFYSSEIENAVAITEIQDLMTRNIATLSGGERQTVLIAAAIAQNTPVIMLDEPTSYLDPTHVDHICKILRNLNSKFQKTIVLITHDINLATLYSGRIIAMLSGAIVYDGDPQEIMNNMLLNRIYGKEFLFTNHPVSNAKIILPDLVLND
ncbi:MAG: ABC transporter ATP-binding protein [Gammaproteobacteria bacterium]|nr:MAG: ABC transporter ATP-binding protein [Gammaproteobacteria bacterium]